MGPSCPFGIFRVGPAKTSSLFCHIINPSLTKLVRSRWLYIGLVLFAVLLTETKIAKTRTWPVSSHIGRTSLVNINAYSLLYVLKSVKFSNTFFSLDREWFYLLSKEVFNPYYGLFEYSARSVQMMVFDSHERFDHSLFPHAFYG